MKSVIKDKNRPSELFEVSDGLCISALSFRCWSGGFFQFGCFGGFQSGQLGGYALFDLSEAGRFGFVVGFFQSITEADFVGSAVALNHDAT